MQNPVLLAVDDDLEALRDVERELGRRYGEDYRVVCLTSPDKALGVLTRLSDAGEDVAVVLAAQWLSGMTGSDLLERVRQLHPHAKRALLVPWRAWGDRRTADAILRSMALGRIDYYVLRPAQSPDELFHGVMSSFLHEWARTRRVASHAVQIVGDAWSRSAHRVRDLLQRNGIPHHFCLPSTDEGRALRAKAGGDMRLPLVVFPDGRVVADPNPTQLAEALGVAVDPEREHFDVVVVGAGPAGLSAAVYGASEGLSTLVIEEQAIGGQAGSSSMIRNYLGFPRGIGGADLAGQAYQQAWVFGAQFVFARRATAIRREGDRVCVTLSDDRRITARAVVLATGASYRRLGVPALEELSGAGVFYGGAAAEAPAMEGQDVYVVGGANSAAQAALHLARHARRVTLVVRASSLRAGASEYLVREIEAAPNVDVRADTTVASGQGAGGRLRSLVLRRGATGEEETVPAAALFVLIGARPHTAWLPKEIARDGRGFLLTGSDVPDDDPHWPLDRRPLLLETSVPGVFAAGDVRNGSVKRVASAVGEGSIAIQLVHSLPAVDGAAWPAASPAGAVGLGAEPRPVAEPGPPREAANDAGDDPAGANLDLVRRIYDAWNTQRHEAVLDLLAPEFEWVNPGYAVEPGTRGAPGAWMRAHESLDATFGSFIHEPGEMLDLGDKVLVMTTFRARGRGSGVEIEKPEPHVWTLREGKAVRLEWFSDEPEALRAAGLAEGRP